MKLTWKPPFSLNSANIVESWNIRDSSLWKQILIASEKYRSDSNYPVTHPCLQPLHKYSLSVYKVPGSVIAGGKTQSLPLKVLSLAREMDVHKRMLSGPQRRHGGWAEGVDCAWEGCGWAVTQFQILLSWALKQVSVLSLTCDLKVTLISITFLILLIKIHQK